MNFLADNTAIVTLLALTLLVLLLLGVVVWAAMKGAGQSGKPEAPKERRISTDSLRQSFRVAVELIEANLAARAERYNLNWTLVLNEGGSGRELPLTQSGLPSALSADSSFTASGQGISWNFFDQGVAIQLQTRYLGSPDPAEAGSNNTWDAFLGLCRSYRPDRPFDGIVLALPASLFLEGEGQDPLDVAARAKAIHRRLWLAQNRLALRFPLYIAITECEAIPGFARLAAALPETLRSSMLGWSSPYELSAPYQSQWVDAALNEIERSLADASAELCALEPAGADSRDYFLLPAQVERLRAGLKLFTDELMRPSAYHEPFLLRGMYLTGDCSEAAVLAGAAAGAEPPPVLIGDESPPLDSLPAPLPGGALEPVLDEAAFLAPGQGAQASSMPAFLRDLFERKIFVETGLVRSASSQRMRRPAVNRALRWGAVLVPAVWIAGLGFATVRLDGTADRMVTDLNNLNQDSARSLRADLGRPADPARSRKRAIDALANIGRMDAGTMRSFFMPGSWSWFDGLHDHLQRRMEQGFADNAFDPLRRAAYQRVSDLTGVAVDPVSGSLIAGARCTLPQNWAQNTDGGANALNVEDLPEFGATLQYLAQLEKTEKLLTAMMRLKSPRNGPASGDDLALVVHMLLGVELNGNTARTAALFRQVAQSGPELTVEPMQEAAICAFGKAMDATTKRLFGENGMLAAERQIAENARALLDAGPRPADPAAALAAWQQLRIGLHVQERYMVGGKGAWMRGNTLVLGPAWDNMLLRTGQLGLLGKAPADEARKQAETGFVQFQAAWEGELSSDPLIEGMSSGLEWSDTNHGWTFAPDRKDLLDGLNGMLAQPYMKFNPAVRFPQVPAGATVSWDVARLDQALALGDARKRFQADLMPKFPAPLQSGAAALADAGLVHAARDLLSQSYFVAGREIQAPANEAGRGRALRLRSWLEDVGATAAAEELNAVLVKDALSRLQQLDDALTQAQLFVPKDRAFRGWTGEKGPLLDAFGAADAAGLNGYVAQQLSFIENAGKDAEALLLQIGTAQAGNPLVARWQATVADLQRYRLKSPTSSLMTLEQFVLAGAADIEGGNCLDKLSARAAQRRGADPFAERMQMLQAGLYTRCRELSQTGFDDAWNRFAGAFNSDLANRSPFRAAPDAAVKGERALAADVEEVGKVLKLYERVPASAQANGKEASRPWAPVNLKKVDEQMQAVQGLLAPLYPADDSQAAGIDVTAEFRANQAAEVDGNKIIDWSLAIGNQGVSRRDPARPLRWTPGLPVVLTLRLAQDGPVVPKPDPGQSDLAVDQRTVSYRFEDPWALLSFVSAHRDPDAGARAQLLRFEFPTSQPGEGGRVQVRDGRARVFVRLTLSAPGKRTPLPWPSGFPAKVPTW